MPDISIIKLNKADKPYQILMLKDEESVQIFKIQMDKNLFIDKNQAHFKNEEELEAALKKNLDIKGTIPNEIKTWCQKKDIIK